MDADDFGLKAETAGPLFAGETAPSRSRLGNGAERIGAEGIGAEGIGAEGIGAEGMGAERIGVERIGVERIAVERIGVERVGVERIEGPFSRSTVHPERAEMLVGSVIWRHQGRGNPISIARLIETFPEFTVRKVKETVEQLVVTHRCRIGARRGDPEGYFWVVDAEDQAAAVKPYRAQIIAMLRRLRVLDSPEDYREFVGQLQLDEK